VQFTVRVDPRKGIVVVALFSSQEVARRQAMPSAVARRRGDMESVGVE
jgi:hypothetical protein